MDKLLQRNYEACGALIASARVSQSKSQQVMADFLSVSKRTVQNWECGKSAPDIAISRALDSVKKKGVI